MTSEGFKKIRDTEKLTRGEKLYVINMVLRLGGTFPIALFEAIAAADSLSRMKLARGFPDEVAAYREWTQGDLYDRASEIAGEACS